MWTPSHCADSSNLHLRMKWTLMIYSCQINQLFRAVCLGGGETSLLETHIWGPQECDVPPSHPPWGEMTGKLPHTLAVSARRGEWRAAP